MHDHPTRAGRRLLYTFQKTEVERIIDRGIADIEDEAYAKGYADGMATPDDPDLDIPVIPKEPE